MVENANPESQETQDNKVSRISLIMVN